MFSSLFITGYGSGIVYATGQGVVKVEIPDLSRGEAASQNGQVEFEPSEITVLAAHLLQRYFEGECVDFGSIPVLFDGLTPFRKKILTAIRSITYGNICTYGQIARECGSPSAARAVGGALAANPVPVIIPCHRVIGSNGHLTGFSAPGGESSKKVLLKMEGIQFNRGQIVTNQMFIHRTSSRK